MGRTIFFIIYGALFLFTLIELYRFYRHNKMMTYVSTIFITLHLLAFTLGLIVFVGYLFKTYW